MLSLPVIQYMLYSIKNASKQKCFFDATITVSFKIRMALESKPQEKQAVVLAADPTALKWSLSVTVAGLRHTQKLNFY